MTWVSSSASLAMWPKIDSEGDNVLKLFTAAIDEQKWHDMLACFVVADLGCWLGKYAAPGKENRIPGAALRRAGHQSWKHGTSANWIYNVCITVDISRPEPWRSHYWDTRQNVGYDDSLQSHDPTSRRHLSEVTSLSYIVIVLLLINQPRADWPLTGCKTNKT